MGPSCEWFSTEACLTWPLFLLKNIYIYIYKTGLFDIVTGVNKNKKGKERGVNEKRTR